MDEKQLRKEPELPERIVGRHGSLRTFVPEETTPDVCLLDHGHVVRTVTN